METKHDPTQTWVDKEGNLWSYCLNKDRLICLANGKRMNMLNNEPKMRDAFALIDALRDESGFTLEGLNEITYKSIYERSDFLYHPTKGWIKEEVKAANNFDALVEALEAWEDWVQIGGDLRYGKASKLTRAALQKARA